MKAVALRQASGAAGLAATPRPDSTDPGRATGRARRPAHPGVTKRASEAAPRDLLVNASQRGSPE